jgi:ornithine--oxo-acid transaminase
MNSIIKRFGKQSLNLSVSNISKLFINTNMKFFSNSFGAKKISLSTDTSDSVSGSKVRNVSTPRGGKRKALDFVEEVEEKEPEVQKKRGSTSVNNKKTTSTSKVSSRKSAAPEKKKAVASSKSKQVEEPKTQAKTPAKTQKKIEAKSETKVKESPVPKKKVNKMATTTPSTDEPTEEITIKKDSIKTPKKASHTLQTKPTSSEETKETKVETTPEPKRRPPPRKKAEPVNKDPMSQENPQVDFFKIGKVRLDTELDPTKYTTNPLGLYHDYIQAKCTPTTKTIIAQEKEVLCQNYAPLPVICTKGKGVYLQDVDGHIYLDFLSAYSAVNQGHCNTNIVRPTFDQMMKLHMTSRAFYNDVLYRAATVVTKLFAYEKVLFMNSGVEAGESAVKIARRWSYVVKGIPDDSAKIIFAKGNFWGRSLYACETSDDPSRYYKFGPFPRQSHYMVEYGNIEEIRNLLETDPNIAAIFIEPIQGEGGVILPPPGYLTEVSNLCKKHNVLFIADEIQTGIGRAGYLLASQMEGVHPDIALLGKSLSGGLYPVSAVLASKKVMDVIKPGEHGSTYGGNPLAAEICIQALTEIVNKSMIANSFYRGIEFGLILREELEKNRLVKEVRGRGLMYAVEFWPEAGIDAYDMSIWLMERGILCKPTKQYTLR